MLRSFRGLGILSLQQFSKQRIAPSTSCVREYSVFGRLKSFAKPNLEQEAGELDVVDFKNPQLGIESLLTRSDEDLGGFSTVHLDLIEEEKGQPFARFNGEISLDLPEDRPEVVRLGYAMFRTKDLPPSLMGLGSPSFHDWSPYTQLSMRVRGDYRKYFINIQADTPYPTDLYQHRLFLRTPGEWETVTVSFANFILTNGGVIQQQERMDTSAVSSVGIGLIDGQYGPYQLDIAWIKVHRGEEPLEEAEPAEIGETSEAVREGAESEASIGAEGSPLSPTGELPEDGAKNPQGRSTKTPGKRLSVDD